MGPKHLADLPTHVYRLSNACGLVLYVGATHDLEQRLKAHRIGEGRFRHVTQVEFETYPTRGDAFGMEAKLIEELQPPYNVVGVRYDPHAEAKRAARRRMLHPLRELEQVRRHYVDLALAAASQASS